MVVLLSLVRTWIYHALGSVDMKRRELRYRFARGVFLVGLARPGFEPGRR